MRIRDFASLALCTTLLSGALPPLPAIAAVEPFLTRNFLEPIDAFSVRLPADSASFRYQYFASNTWSDWQTYESDGDVLPGQESELLMVPEGTTGLRIEHISDPTLIHPITVSKDPIHYKTAAAGAVGAPAILSRSEWGADAALLYTDGSETEAEARGDNGVTLSGQTNGRVDDCMKAQVDYPAEFNVASTVTKDAQGKLYSWPLQYSPQVKLLAVHHSALVIRDDPRPAVERVRALYKYHAASKGWGDIGYHFVVDENGQIYEGRQGGKFVVGGHAYCNNVGTIGIVLLGNFEIEQPSQKQAQSLQWLLSDLARKYNIDVNNSVQFHGKKFVSPIVRHRDLLSTLCPGYYLSEAFGQIVKNVRSGNINGTVTFPVISRSSSSSSASSMSSIPGAVQSNLAPGIAFYGRTTITINPGGKQRLSFTYTADERGAYEGKKVADLQISSSDIKLYVDNGRGWVPVTKGILLQSDLPAHETASLQLVIEAPMNPGSYWMDIGGIRFTISVAGRRMRMGTFVSPFNANSYVIVEPISSSRSSLAGRIRSYTRPSMQGVSSSVTSFSSSLRSSFSSSFASRSSAVSTGTPIRIRLSSDGNPTVTFSNAGSVGNTSVSAGTALSLFIRGSECVATRNGSQVQAASILRLSPGAGTTTITGIGANKTRSYKGAIECRVINGSMALINELPLDDYMAGLAEEPDTEPYEKQRAFAIAARTYAAFYMDPANRKFAGMPYDGSDNPAEFQVYAGVDFTASNPNWARAVQTTANQVLTYNGQIIKPPYFSSDDGRTRTPIEAGWKNFPFAEIFSSKKDPWCSGMTLRGHGVGMSGCGALGQAKEGRSAEQILQYYYPGVRIGER